MRRLFAIMATLPLVGCAASVAQKPEEPNAELRAELRKRVQEDQDARRQMIAWMKEHGVTDPAKAKQAENEPIAKKLAEIDEANTKWLKGIVEKHGWPGTKLVGEPGAYDAWLLVQHADRDREFQKKCLGLMKPLVETGEVAKGDFAYLTDRVLIADGKKQLYGTQFRDVNGKIERQQNQDEPNPAKR